MKKLTEFVMEKMNVNQHQVMKDMATVKDRAAFTKAKIIDIEETIPELIRSRIAIELKLHLDDLESRKVDTQVFNQLIAKKLDKNALSEIKQQAFSSGNHLTLSVSELSAKVEQVLREHSRNVSLDVFERELIPLARIEHFSRL